MAEFHNLVVTNAGLNLVALSAAMEKPIVFDRMDIGSGRPADSSKVASMTAIVTKQLEATIADMNTVTNTTSTSEARYRILGSYSNSSLATGFKISEVGLYAHVESNYYQDTKWNDYTGGKVLFGYFYADEGKEDWLPSKDTPMDDLKTGVYISISNAASVAVYINEENNVSLQTFEAHLKDPNAHSDLKGCTSTADGLRGFAPTPTKGMQDDYYLGADGTWKQVKQRSVKDIIDIIYPVGALFTTTGSQNPNQLWAGTTWERYAAGRVLVGAGSYVENNVTYTYTNGATGGEAKHQLTIDEIPSHDHSAACSTNGSHTHGYTEYVSNKSPWHLGTDGAGNTQYSQTSAAGNHNHTITIGNAGGNGFHENRQPYTVVNFWRRTA